jgi:ABC-type iron transport system FetAB permease component
VSALFLMPLGYGIGSFPHVWTDVARKLSINPSSHEVLQLYDTIYPQTYFATVCNDVGVFALLLFVLIFIYNKKRSNFNSKVITVIMILFFFQSQITSPLLWFLIAVLKKDYQYKPNEETS